MICSVRTLGINGIHGAEVTAECFISNGLPGFDIVVVARTRAIYGRYADLERSFLQLMKKLGILAPK